MTVSLYGVLKKRWCEKYWELSVVHTSKCLVCTALYIDIIPSYQVSAGLTSSDVGVSMWDAHTLSEKAIPFSLSIIRVKHSWLDPTKHWVFPVELTPSTGQALPGGISYTAGSGHCVPQPRDSSWGNHWLNNTIVAWIFFNSYSFFVGFFFPTSSR